MPFIVLVTEELLGEAWICSQKVPWDLHRTHDLLVICDSPVAFLSRDLASPRAQKREQAGGLRTGLAVDPWAHCRRQG